MTQQPTSRPSSNSGKTRSIQALEAGSAEMPPCILCNQKAVKHWFVRETETGNYSIVRCGSCGSAYTWPRPTESELQEIYFDGKTSPIHNDPGLYWPSAQTDAVRLFKSFGLHSEGRTLLDIGAGDGFAAEEAIRRGLTVLACEPSPQHRKEFLSRNGFEPDSNFFDNEYAMRHRSQIDVVLVSHVLEHLSNLEQFLNDVSLVLRPGGGIIIAVPLFGSIVTALLGKRDFFITPPVHLTYFSHAGLRSLLKKHGYVVESMYTSSKVNMHRYRGRLGAASYVINLAAYGVLRLSELVNRSVVLNIYAKRIL